MSKFLDVTLSERKEIVGTAEYKKPPYDWRYENSISNGKKIDIDTDYSQWRINSIVAGYDGCAGIVNEMNIHYNVTDQMHYDYLFGSIRKMRRMGKKKTEDEKRKEQEAKRYEALLTLVSAYYKYNKLRAKEALKILTAEQIEYIKQKQEKGGVS